MNKVVSFLASEQNRTRLVKWSTIFIVVDGISTALLFLLGLPRK
ncbi:hypothetical protein C8K18_105191 [Paraburkholderia sp. GV068]|jgi:hypothetical protein|uniref:Uncharacterized protein n=2 Tax=Paraburkholderia graminis TaxID=60548 RepID=B1FZ14_PARG4|nr:hypothetical protein BgramDRAFT_2333 [Paraburkholderia graminis C4D1M]MDQ0623211.1 hypothetical protein [Paraburkholderia graminis]PTR00423.1 hypothetical protein C8K19_105191 [Paraburkholderia sp. GV072]PUB05271.1 hypothetical protein C8K18_105191 [Paraburkholderia sp. GV068]MDR6203822.1 hypothetical protein [Paraburkholderia graminis]